MTEAPTTPGPQVRRKDPWKGLRGIQAGTLVMEAITVALSLLVIAKFDGITSLGAILVGALAVAMVVASGVQGKPWGVGLAVALQVLMIACGFVVFALGVLGVVFALVWGALLWLRQDLRRREAAQAAAS
ncbi:DUF4233 domain-containing protein [Allokutzneria sp. NRRL B-24872]|uniref:DUF4233 domain-containing protein n=1 Tax=Allokutzneria sp. NRRL B-24872 TaxID=1137961 RepID=UPI000A39500C|nr:DUF4233 domain-containing protein [Allokutzneria sp. NRRL B-24872]